MSLLDDILAHNREYVEDQNTGYVDTDTKCSKMPSREMAIVTCMDTRLVNFLEDSMDIGRGEAKIVKTAGNCITGPFDGIVRSLRALPVSGDARFTILIQDFMILI